MAESLSTSDKANTADPVPKVFISHAGEDRERFVRRFAERLRANGIDAWASFWEINPGDSLVDKIFEEGLKDCRAFIVVLSNNSVNKPWVREELDAGMVRKIERQTKIIAVRLDGCEIPECLKHIRWQDLTNTEVYDAEFERILNAIFGVYDKPPVGKQPAYTRLDVLQIGDLTRIDSVIFETACRMALDGDSTLINPHPLVAALTPEGISETQIMETQEILESRGYIELLRTAGPPHVDAFNIRQFGFDQYAKVAVPDFDRICTDVVRMLVRGESMGHRGIAQELNQPTFLIEHIFRLLESNGLVKCAQSISGGLHMSVSWVSPELKRKLEQS